MKLKSTFKWAAGVLTLMLAASCTAIFLGSLNGGVGGGSGTGPGISTGTASYEYSDDPNNSLLITGTNDSGDAIVVYGTKLSDGTPSSITGFEITAKGESAPTIFTVDGSNKITQVIAPNEVVMNLDWQSKTSVVVSLYDPNTRERLNTFIDENTKSVTFEPVAKPARRAPLDGEHGIVEIPVDARQAASAPDALTKADGVNPEVKGTVIVTACGEPVMAANPAVYVYEANYFEKCIAKYPASYNSLGSFEYILPAGAQPHNNISLANFCSSVENLLGKLCNVQSAIGGHEYVMQVLCPGIAATITGLGMGTSSPAAAAFLAACTSTAMGLYIYCNSWGFSPDGDWDGVSPNPNKDKIYEALHHLDIEWDTPLYIEPRSPGFGGDVIGKRILYKGGSELPVAYMSFGDAPKVHTIYLTPVYPKALQSYTIEAEVHCAIKGSVVTITVRGTDDYEDEQKYNVTQGTKEKKFSLVVPGGEKGVRDEIVVTIDTPDGKHDGLVTHLSFGAAD